MAEDLEAACCENCAYGEKLEETERLPACIHCKVQPRAVMVDGNDAIPVMPLNGLCISHRRR